jgi:acyl carrier protein
LTKLQSEVSEEMVLSHIRRHLGDVMGDPDLLSTDITMDTKFGSDLELESIEFVALAAHLSMEFGDRVNFVEFLSGKDVDEIVSLTVGDVVRYVESCLNTKQLPKGARP